MDKSKVRRLTLLMAVCMCTKTMIFDSKCFVFKRNAFQNLHNYDNYFNCSQKT